MIEKESWNDGKYQYKVEYNTKWMLVFQHNTSFGYFTEENADYNFEKGKFSILRNLGNPSVIKRFNKSFEFLLEYPAEFPGQYNRWIQSANPFDVLDVHDQKYIAPGYTPIHINFSSFFGGLVKSTSNRCLLDAEPGYVYWNYGIGDWSGTYSPNTTGPPYISVSFVNLWIRILAPFIRTCLCHKKQICHHILLFVLLFVS